MGRKGLFNFVLSKMNNTLSKYVNCKYFNIECWTFVRNISQVISLHSSEIKAVQSKPNLQICNVRAIDTVIILREYSLSSNYAIYSGIVKLTNYISIGNHTVSSSIWN